MHYAVSFVDAVVFCSREIMDDFNCYFCAVCCCNVPYEIINALRDYYLVEFAYISTSGGLQKSADIRELPM